MVSAGPVLPGDTWTMLALSSTGITFWATLELYVPTTPAIAGSSASVLAACWPTCGVAWSSSARSSIFQPGSAFCSFAWRIARSTELRMPSPIADRLPVSGAITPIFTTFCPSAAPPSDSFARVPHAASARAPTTSRAPLLRNAR